MCGDESLAQEGEPLVELAPRSLVLSAFKPAESGKGVVLRVLNPAATAQTACVTLGFPFERAEPLRLDEAPADFSLSREGATLHLEVPPHALRTFGVL